MNVKIIRYKNFPIGMASTARIRYYAKGIIEAGSRVQILVQSPSWPNFFEKNRQATGGRIKGVYESVPYEFMCGTLEMPKRFLLRRFVEIKAALRTARALVRERKTTSAVHIITNQGPFIAFFAVLCRILGIKSLFEKTELPFFDSPPRSGLQTLYQSLYKRYLFQLLDGILVISRPLHNFFKPRIRKNAKLLPVPIIVDPEEFSGHQPAANRLPAVVMCGALTQSKEGVFTLVEAFARLQKTYPEARLHLVGSAEEPDLQKIRELAEKLSIEKKVFLEGFVDDSRLKELLCGSTALALAKPRGLQADYCFPSKPGEYLASSTPVAVTDTGEISSYLEDGITAFIAAPDSVDAFA